MFLEEKGSFSCKLTLRTFLKSLLDFGELKTFYIVKCIVNMV